MRIPSFIKSLGALLAGLIVGIALSIGTDVLMETTGIFPSFAEQAAHGMHVWWMLALALTYRCLYQIIASYIGAMLAPGRPMLHAMILGWIAFVVSAIGTVAMWNLGDHWYPILLTILSPVCAWIGGKMALMRLKK